MTGMTDTVGIASGGSGGAVHRTKTRRVLCGSVPIGGGAPIPIQSMTNTLTEDVSATAAQALALARAGADIVRCAVPTIAAAQALKEIKAHLSATDAAVPLVADIHFDHRVALAAIKAGADKVRINPGNIGGTDRVKAVVDAAGAAGIPMRIGVNSGSVEENLKGLYEERPAEALAESALRGIALLQGMGFSGLVVSVKSADVLVNTEAHRILASYTDVPLHIGITEAGYGDAAIVKSAVGIGALLATGIGDTMRVSLTGDPVHEIDIARDILRAANLLQGQISLISCPTCGRCRVDIAAICEELAPVIAEIERERMMRAGRPIVVAVMGCAVNGPGEAAHADLGVACGPDGAVYFESGVKKGRIPPGEIAKTVIEGIKSIQGL